MTALVAIATRNNPVGLACLLGSIREPVEVSICDASDCPVIAHPQVSRVLANQKTVHYSHTSKPNLVEQRIAAAEAWNERRWVIFLDDDLLFQAKVPLSETYHDIEECTHGFIQGFKIDSYNERRYPDFHQAKKGPHHPPIRTDPQSPYIEVDSCDPFRFDGGVFATTPEVLEHIKGIYLSAPVSYPAMKIPSGIEDDTLIQLLGERTDSVLHDGLLFTHLGNSNNNWSAQEDKEFAVDLLKRT